MPGRMYGVEPHFALSRKEQNVGKNASLGQAHPEQVATQPRSSARLSLVPSVAVLHGRWGVRKHPGAMDCRSPQPMASMLPPYDLEAGAQEPPASIQVVRSAQVAVAPCKATTTR